MATLFRKRSLQDRGRRGEKRSPWNRRIETTFVKFNALCVGNFSIDLRKALKIRSNIFISIGVLSVNPPGATFAIRYFYPLFLYHICVPRSLNFPVKLSAGKKVRKGFFTNFVAILPPPKFSRCRRDFLRIPLLGSYSTLFNPSFYNNYRGAVKRTTVARGVWFLSTSFPRASRYVVIFCFARDRIKRFDSNPRKKTDQGKRLFSTKGDVW